MKLLPLPVSLGLFALCTAKLSAQHGPPGNYNWIQNPANGHYYAVPAAVMGWSEAKDLADALGENVELATIRNGAEAAWVVGNLTASPVWIGFTDEAQEGVWAWRSGEPVTYENWAPGEPDDAGAGQDACSFNELGAGTFADEFASRDRLALLEWQPAGGLTLVKLGGCAGPISLEVRQASPDGHVVFLYGRAGNSTKPTPPCAGITLALTRPHFGGSVLADFLGRVSLTFNVPAGACGLSVQAVDVASCTVSNFVVI